MTARVNTSTVLYIDDMGNQITPFVCDICGDDFGTTTERREHIFAAHEIGEDDA